MGSYLGLFYLGFEYYLRSYSLTSLLDWSVGLEADRVQHCAEGDDNVVAHDLLDIALKMPLWILLTNMTCLELLRR